MSGRSGSRVLVVDDDPSIREFVHVALEEDGFDVREAANGAEALEVLGVWRADVVLLDLMMPVLDGWEFRRRQREDRTLAAIHVIVMSANRCLPSAEAVLSPCAMLAKPFDLIDLLQRTARCAAEAAQGRTQAV